MAGGTKLDLQRRQHRERGQPLHRKRLGLLEKHRDYVARARDYHGKQDRIRSLKRKASERNPDELYFGMVRGQTKSGVHVQSRGNEALPTDIVKLLKTQDVKYVRSQRTSEERKVTKLREQLASQVEVDEPASTPIDDDADMFDDAPVAGPSKPKRTVFTDSLDTLRSSNPLKALGRSSKGKQRAIPDDAASARSAHRATLKAELDAREKRNLALARAEREIELQRLLMARGAKRGILKRKREADEPESEDEGELEGPRKNRLRGLPKPDQGIKTGARVWKWRAQRQR